MWCPAQVVSDVFCLPAGYKKDVPPYSKHNFLTGFMTRAIMREIYKFVILTEIKKELLYMI